MSEDRYECRLYDWHGGLLSVFDTWRSLSASIKINGVSSHQFAIDSNDPRVPLFKKDYFFQIRRSNDILDWHTLYLGFHRTPQYQISPDGYEIFTSYGRSLEDLLRRRSLAYYAPYSKTGPADTVMKSFVNENAGPGAISPRFRNGQLLNFTVQASFGLGPQWTGERTYRNLLDIVTEISLVSGVDFAVVPNPNIGTFQFRTYFPLGTDRTVTTGTTPHIFSPAFGNVAVPDFTTSATEEATTIIALGSGQEGFRTKLIGSDLIASGATPWSDIELIRDARNEETVAGLQSIINTELLKNAAKENLTFDVIQTPASTFGVHYNLGDLITISFGNVVRDKRILGVDINVAGPTNTLNFKFGDTEYLPDDPTAVVVHVIRNLVKRMQSIEHSGTI